MAGDNLKIGIEVNSQKARDDLALTESKMRSLRKEVRALADEANKDPVALAKFKAANAELTKLDQTVRSLQKDVRALGQAGSTAAHGLSEASHAKHAHGFYLVEQSVQSLSGAFQALGHNV